MKRRDFFRIMSEILFGVVWLNGWTQIGHEVPLLQIGEFPLTSQAFGAFGTVPRWDVPKEILHYYTYFFTLVGAMDQEGVPHVSSREEKIFSELRPVQLSWKERLNLSFPNAKTLTQGIFTDLSEIKEHTPLGLRVTVTACGFDQKGYGLYEFTIERAEKGMPELSGVYVGIQVEINASSSAEDFLGK